MVSFAEDAWSPFNVRCRVHYIDSFDPHVLADGCCATDARRRHRVHGPRDPLVREAVETLAHAGVPW
jgi:LacI family transcriptional regulator